jgi:outer membrane protein assembly factor BamB
VHASTILKNFLITCSAVFLQFEIGTAETNWTRFRSDALAGPVQAAKIPEKWSDTENLRWRTALPGRGSSSPVFINGRIYLTAFTGYGQESNGPGSVADLRLHTLCIDFETGKILWDEAIEASHAEQEASQRVVDHGYASPTPTVDEQGVYAAFGPSGVVAYDHAGKKLWQCSIGSKTAGFGSASSPIVYKDMIIINASIEDGALYSINKKTGTVLWRTEGIKKSWSTPTLVTLQDGTTELIVNQENIIRGFDPETGEELWRCDGIDDYVVPCVVADGDVLYCSGGRQSKTIAVRAGGRGDVTKTHRLWKVVSGANVTSPLLYKGYLYWSHDKSMAMCVKAEDGTEVFRERLPTSARVYASAVLAGDRLLMTTRDAGVLVVAASPEFQELGLNKLGDESEVFSATPAIIGNSILLRSERTLYRISE